MYHRPIGPELRQSLAGRILAEGDVLIVGDPALGLRLEVLHPPRAADEKEATAWTGNEASLILRLTRHGQGLALFTGDAERRSLRRLLASGRDLRAQVLLAPHHGSDRSFLAAFYKAGLAPAGLAGTARHSPASYRRIRADPRQLAVDRADARTRRPPWGLSLRSRADYL